MKTILVVEDDETMRALLATLIGQETFHYPIVVSDGRTAEEVTRDIKPDLLLLDDLLPDMHGIELYDRLHGQEDLCDIPALLLTTHLPQSDLQQALRQRDLPALPKPFDTLELLAAIEHCLVAWHSR